LSDEEIAALEQMVLDSDLDDTDIG